MPKLLAETRIYRTSWSVSVIFPPILNPIWRDKLAKFLRSKCNKMHRRQRALTDILELINTFLPFFMGAPEFLISDCRHLANRGSDLSVLTVTDNRAVQRSGEMALPPPPSTPYRKRYHTRLIRLFPSANVGR